LQHPKESLQIYLKTFLRLAELANLAGEQKKLN
jgi:hypothetical protein